MLALKITGVLGVGQTPLSEDTNDAFTILNTMIAGWSRRRWMIYHLVDVVFQSTGAQSYSIGLNQQFNVTRPDTIEYAFARQQYNTISGAVDYPLDVMAAREDYASIALKQLVSFPSLVFYDATFPIGTVYYYPIPNSTFELHLGVKETLFAFSNLTTTVNLPSEYQEALIWNLAARLRPMYQLPPDPTIIGIAQTSLQVIRGANAQISRLVMPSGLSRSGGQWASHGIGGIVNGTFTLNQTTLG